MLEFLLAGIWKCSTRGLIMSEVISGEILSLGVTLLITSCSKKH